VIRNLLWIALHHGVGRAGMFFFFMALPVLLPIGTVGRFTLWYTALLVVTQPLVDFSLSMVVTKYTARADLGATRTAFGLGLTALPLLLGVLWLASRAVPAPHRLITLLVLAFAFTLPLNLVFAAFRGREQMRVEGVVGSLQKASALLVLVGLAAANVGGEELPAFSLLAAALLGWLLLLLLFPRWTASLFRAIVAAPPEPERRWPLLREGLTLGAVGLVGMLYLRVDVIMLGVLADAEEVGLYFTATRCLEAAFMIPNILMLATFPRLVRESDPRPAVRRLATVLFALSVVALAALIVIARWVVPAVYGDELGRIALLLLVLSPAVLPVYLGYLFTQALVAAERERRYLAIALSGLLANIALNAVLIPRLGGVGAAVATVVTELAITVGAAWSFFRPAPESAAGATTPTPPGPAR